MRIVDGEGPIPAELMFVGQGPGIKEHKEGRPFVPWAPAGRVFAELLELCGLSREGVYVTNVYKSYIKGDKEPTREQIREHEPMLVGELGAVQPRVVVALGGVATKYFLGPGVTMEQVHAIPHTVNGYTVFPMYHPAAGLHSPEIGALVRYDFAQLRLLLRGKLLSRPVDEYPHPVYWESDSVIYLSSYLYGHRMVGIDTEGSVECPISVQLSVLPGTSVVVRADDFDGIGWLKDWLSLYSDPPMVILQNALHDLLVLEKLGIHLTNYVDTAVMAYLLQLEPQGGLKPLAFRHCGMTMRDYPDIIRPVHRVRVREYLQEIQLWEWAKGEGRKRGINALVKRALADLEKDPGTDIEDRWKTWNQELKDPVECFLGEFPVTTLDHVSREDFIQYAGRDADATLRIYPRLLERIEAMELTEVLQMDMAILPMVNRMMQVGLPVDVGHFEGLAGEFAGELERIRGEMEQITEGRVTNPGSNLQVGEYLFEHLGIPPPKRTPTGDYCVNVDVMKSLEAEQPVAALRLEYKEIEKLQGTYVAGLSKWIADDGRVHPKLRVTRVVTGRLSSSEPNVLAIPTRTRLGKRIREGFIAPPGFEMLGVDASQLELRVLAHESGDDRMVAAFLEGRDLHNETELRVFGTSGPNRIPSKTLNFGIAYGLTAQGLQWQLIKMGIFWDLEQCQQAIDTLFTTYPGVGSFMRKAQAEARRYGYVRDMWGRIRYIPNIKSRVPWVRAEAEREAGNFKIQSGASGVIKHAMIRIWREVLPELWATGVQVECVLQVHDELIFLVETGYGGVVQELVRDAMESAVQLTVPLLSAAHRGNNWGELK